MTIKRSTTLGSLALGLMILGGCKQGKSDGPQKPSEPAWITFAPELAGFELSLPLEPTEGAQKRGRGDRTGITTRSWELEPDDKSYKITIAWLQTAGVGHLPESLLQTIMDSTMADQEGAIKARSVVESPWPVVGHHFTFKGKRSDRKGLARVYAVNRSIIAIAVTGRDGAGWKTATRALNSLKITAKAEENPWLLVPHQIEKLPFVVDGSASPKVETDKRDGTTMTDIVFKTDAEMEFAVMWHALDAPLSTEANLDVGRDMIRGIAQSAKAADEPTIGTMAHAGLQGVEARLAGTYQGRPLTMWLRALADDKNRYLLVIGGRTDRYSPEAAQQFMASFKLAAGSAPAPVP